jgi:hypothetical protein
MSETAQHSESGPAPSPSRCVTPLSLALPLFFVALPAILFYAILARDLLNIPFYDEYDAVLNFLNHIVAVNGISAKASYFLAAQHNEYKLFLLHGLAWCEFSLSGHIDFWILSVIGNGFVLLLGVLLWMMFLPGQKDMVVRVTLFIPVSWLLFQLQYWENLDWAASSLQHLAVLPFALGAIYLLLRGGRVAFISALLFVILAIGSDGNGLLVIPIGAAILALGRHYKRVAGWLLISAGCLAAYAFGYTARLPQAVPSQSAVSTSHHFNPAYALAFIGSAASFPLKSASFLLGILLCIFFGYMARRGYIRKNPLVSWCVLFLVLTAIGVAGLRSGFGVEQAVVSRYTIYSALLLIFAWFAIVEEILQHGFTSPFHSDIFLCAMLIVVPFSLAMDLGGWMQIERRERALVKAMAAYEHPTSPGSQMGPSPPLMNETADPVTELFNRQVRPILSESIKLGVYRPPTL